MLLGESRGRPCVVKDKRKKVFEILAMKVELLQKLAE